MFFILEMLVTQHALLKKRLCFILWIYVLNTVFYSSKKGGGRKNLRSTTTHFFLFNCPFQSIPDRLVYV